MDMLSPQEGPPEELSYAEREGILWDAAWRYMRGEISAQELQEIEDRYTWHIRSARFRSDAQKKESASDSVSPQYGMKGTTSKFSQ